MSTGETSGRGSAQGFWYKHSGLESVLPMILVLGEVSGLADFPAMALAWETAAYGDGLGGVSASL